ncbi:MAG: cyclic GMP-AMP synthase DncV-like nucleotidyltransferase [Bacteroidia bacterium]
MANCNEIFKHYNSVIKLNENKREILKSVRDELRKRMMLRFLEIPKKDISDHTLEFQSQGSFIMDTIITPKDEDFDLDDGVYFVGNVPKENRPKTEDFHKWVLFAVGENETYASVTDKDTCVRVAYKKEKFHIDLPIYYTYPDTNPDLAHKLTGWTLSGPVEFIVWFEEKAQSGFKQSYLLESRMFTEYEKWLNDIRKTDVQLRRIVRYLKGWGDHLREDMPPGIVMTILAGENYVANERDDIALRDTLQKIKDMLDRNGGKCFRPTTPKGEDLFEKYGMAKKKYFITELEKFINSANQAIASPNQKEACLKWQKHLGDRFPCSLAKDEIEGAKEFIKPAVIGDTAKSA